MSCLSSGKVEGIASAHFKTPPPVLGSQPQSGWRAALLVMRAGSSPYPDGGPHVERREWGGAEHRAAALSRSAKCPAVGGVCSPCRGCFNRETALGPQTPPSRSLCERPSFESPEIVLITPCKVVGSCQFPTTSFLSRHTQPL